MEYLPILSFAVIVGTVALFVAGIQSLDYVCTTDVCEARAHQYRDDFISQKETWVYVFIGFIVLGGVTGLIGLLRDTTVCCISLIASFFKNGRVGLIICFILFVLFVVACYELGNTRATYFVPQLNCTIVCDVCDGDSDHAFAFMILATLLLGLYTCATTVLLAFPERSISYSVLDLNTNLNEQP